MKPGRCSLLEKGQPPDDVQIAFLIVPPEIIEQTAATADQHQQAAPAGVVLGMGVEMSRQFVNAMRKHRNLYFGRTRVAFRSSELLDYLGLTLFRNRHSSILLYEFISDVTTLSRPREYSMSNAPGCTAFPGINSGPKEAQELHREFPSRPSV